jgi:taurine--2-oxoglutarate transaminase
MAEQDSWQERQREHLFFTWTRQAGVQGLEIVDARGARFEVAGKGWVWDLESQVYNVNVGHRHPHVQSRMIEQIERLPACAPNAVLPIRSELGALLAEHTGLHRAFLTTGGSEAVENAIKMARLVTGRSKVVTRRNSYHGATLAVLGIAGDRRKDPYVADLAPAFHIEDSIPVREAEDGRPSSWLESFDELLEREGPESIAAVLLEGFTGTNGMQHPPADFWAGVRERCDRHGILMIDDEIFAGFGRTGRWFAREHWSVPVDMMTIGKGLTSGYAPLAGVMVSEAIAASFEREKLWCGLTHYAHPVSCAAAVGSIEVMAREGLVENAAEVGARLEGGLEEIAARHEQILEVRGLGMMLAVVFDRSCEALVSRLWDLGVYAPHRDEMLFVCPPLCLTQAEAVEILDRLEKGISAWLS